MHSGDKSTVDINPQSYWLDSTEKTDYPALEEDAEGDVVIVGGGMAGITAAYLLKQEGLKVIVVEADAILQGTTGHTTAKITSQHGLIYDQIKRNMGEEKARMYADANGAAIKLIGQLIDEKNIDCDFEYRAAYVYTQEDKYVQKIADEAKTATSLGIEAIYLEEIDLPFKVKAAVRFESQAQFHPRKYLLALAKEIPGDGSHIFEQTRAVDIREGRRPEVITENGRKVRASKVVIASHYPFYDKPGFYFARIYQERSYILAVKIKEKFPGGMYITAEDPGRSLRSQRYGDDEMVLVAGEHHKSGHGKSMLDHYRNLQEFAHNTFTVQEYLYRWSTQDCVTVDEVPYIGRLTSAKPDIYVATGFNKWGMTGTTAAAMLIRDLIVKGENPWLSLYDPSRFTPKASAVNFIKENADVAVDFIAGRILPAAAEKEVAPNEGKVISVEGRRAGAYRDGKGELHLVDTTCTHLGCKLNWNDAETTWDCPCHGSRFSIDGDIVEGPAVKRLPVLKQES